MFRYLLFVFFLVHVVKSLPTEPPHKPVYGIIMPGTKWCGPGAVAKDFDDLGIHAETDKCCRAHDYCPDIIEGYTEKSEKYGLKNPSPFTKLSCDCNEAFLKCLKNVNNLVSKTVGKVYFELQDVCFRKDYPAQKCLKQQYQLLFIPRCTDYQYDKTLPVEYQYFHNPRF